jgi:hypothetical protein
MQSTRTTTSGTYGSLTLRRTFGDLLGDGKGGGRAVHGDGGAKVCDGGGELWD